MTSSSTAEQEYAYKDEFPDASYKPHVFFSKAARMRRQQLRLFNTGVQFHKPFWRFLSITSDIRIVALTAFWMVFWVFTVATEKNPVEWATGFFLVLLACEYTYWMAVKLHGWVMRHWASSMKVNVGSMPPLPAGDLVPGARVRTISFPKDETGKEREIIPVELIACGYVGKTQWGLTKATGPFIVAHARFKNNHGQACAGVLFGTEEYLIPAKHEEFRAGDINNWRAKVYLKVLKEEFKGAITDTSIIVVAMDPFDFRPEASAPAESHSRQEMYELAQRERKVTRRHTDELRRDRTLEAAQGGGREYG
jgi:hypothetical protein